MKTSFLPKVVCIVTALVFNSVAVMHLQAAPIQNTTTVYRYDSNGNVIERTDPLGNVTSAAYDSLNRLTRLYRPAPAASESRPLIRHYFDGLDRTMGITDPRQLNTSYTIDGLDNQSALTSPDTGTKTNTFDMAGNLITSTDARGKVVTYSYDVLNRLTRIGYPSDTPTRFEYDGGASGTTNGIGHLTKMTDASGTTSYQYDQFGRLTAKVQTTRLGPSTKSFINTYEYGTNGNTLGKVVGATYPSGNRIGYTYDDAGNIDNVSITPPGVVGSIPLLSNIRYSPFGAPQGWNWGPDGGVGSSLYLRNFDLDGRLTSYPLGNKENGGLIRTVNYDAANRITSYVHKTISTGLSAPDFDQSFTYDNLDRLTAVRTSSSLQNYTYDANGNRKEVRYGTSIHAYVVDAASNRLLTTQSPSATQFFNYDATGSLQAGTVNFSYNDRGLPSSVFRVDIGSVEYTYNGLDQRVLKTGQADVIPSGSNFYVYDEKGKLIGEYDANGKPLQETVYLGVTPISVLMQNASSGTSVFDIYTDQIDTPRFITSSSSNDVVWRWDNADPFGRNNPNENPGGAGNFPYNLRMPGQLFDKETNNFYNNYRIYDPQTGRFLQSDPIGLSGGVNTYSYVNGNPINSIDPLGLAEIPLYVKNQWVIDFVRENSRSYGFDTAQYTDSQILDFVKFVPQSEADEFRRSYALRPDVGKANTPELVELNRREKEREKKMLGNALQRWTDYCKAKGK